MDREHAGEAAAIPGRSRKLPTQTLKRVMAEQAQVIAWRVEFESGAVELWPAEEFTGMPGFGRLVTPLIAGGDTIDHCPDQAEE